MAVSVGCISSSLVSFVAGISLNIPVCEGFDLLRLTGGGGDSGQRNEASNRI